MAEYPAYSIGIDGHIVGFEALVCADDVEAINKAKRLVDGHDIELWSGLRLVIRLNRKTVDKFCAFRALVLHLGADHAGRQGGRQAKGLCSIWRMNDRQFPTAINPDGVAERKFGD